MSDSIMWLRFSSSLRFILCLIDSIVLFCVAWLLRSFAALMVVALSGLAHSKPNQYEENMRSEKISRKFLYLKQIISEIYIYIAITPHHSEDSLQDTYKWGRWGEANRRDKGICALWRGWESSQTSYPLPYPSWADHPSPGLSIRLESGRRSFK